MTNGQQLDTNLGFSIKEYPDRLRAGLYYITRHGKPWNGGGHEPKTTMLERDKAERVLAKLIKSRINNK